MDRQQVEGQRTLGVIPVGLHQVGEVFSLIGLMRCLTESTETPSATLIHQRYMSLLYLSLLRRPLTSHFGVTNLRLMSCSG